MAKLFHDASASVKQVLDLDLVWRKQAVPEPLMRAALIAAAEAAQVISSPPAGIRNMSEWAKQQACWAKVKSAMLTHDDDFERCLIDRDLVREEEDGEDGENEIDVGIEAQIKVTSAGGAFWADLLEWGRANRKLSEREAKTLEICSNYPRKIPTDFQCKQAVSVLERLKHDGFVEAQA